MKVFTHPLILSFYHFRKAGSETLGLWFVVGLLLIVGPCVRAQTNTNTVGRDVQRLSLSDAVQEALEENYGIRIAQSQLDAARNNDDYALTGKYPTVTLGLSPTVGYRNNTNPASIVVSSTTTSYGLAPSANVNWTLFNGGRIEIAKEQLATFADLSAGQLQVQVQNTVQDVINAYYAAVVAQEQIRVRERVLELSGARIEYQNVRREFGQGGTFDLLQSRDAYLNDSLSLEIQRTTFQNSVRNLLQVMGRESLSAEGVDLTTELNYEPGFYDRQTLVDQLELSNPTLNTLRVNRELANINTRLIETERKPTVGVGAGLGYDITVQTGTQTFDFGGDQPSREQNLPGIAARTLTGNIGVTASYLLYDGNNRNVRIQTAKLDEITAQLNYQSTSQQLRSLLLNALDLYENQQEVIAITETLIANAERNIEVAEERFRGGTINSFDYRAIQLNYVNAEFQLLQSLLNLKNTETTILGLTGGIVD